jgi:hypothetical protein
METLFFFVIVLWRMCACSVNTHAASTVKPKTVACTNSILKVGAGIDPLIWQFGQSMRRKHRWLTSDGMQGQRFEKVAR